MKSLGLNAGLGYNWDSTFSRSTVRNTMGLSPRLRFKLEKLKSAVRSTFMSKEPSFDTSLRMCPACRALIERNAARCPHCGVSLKAPRAREGTAPGRVMGGLIPVPSTATSALVAANIAFYGVAWYLTQEAASAQLTAAPAWGGVDYPVLIRLGGKFGPLIFAGEWWRLVTAVFLHASLIHIGFNLWCLFDLGPAVESLFTTQKFIFIYLVTGVLGFIVSLWWSPGLSIGASGAILGLIGVLIGVSFHHGSMGKEYRGQLWRWVIYIAIFGLLGMGVDNAAHIGGLISGLALGYLIPEGEPDTRAGENLWNALAILSVVIIAGSFALMALQFNAPIY
ncbi:MAG TPA: rhomboid family intramembrane serine protease [Terriglobia bacterium]|nr:rhomboid family intramembrane serine protease [Terriglobia bacterium]